MCSLKTQSNISFKNTEEHYVALLDMHMSNTGSEHSKALAHLIGQLKGKNTKVIIIRNPKVIKVFIFCN